MKLRCLSTPHKVRGQYDDKSIADQVGVSKSEVSRESIEAGTRVLKELAERDLSELDVLVVYLDGIVFGDYHVLAAVGVDADGRKHVLGLCGGASENTEVTAGLLEDLVGGSCIPSFCQHQITPKTSRYTRCSMSIFPNVSINGRIRSSGQLGRWWYSISPCRNNECVRRFTVFAFNQRS